MMLFVFNFNFTQFVILENISSLSFLPIIQLIVNAGDQFLQTLHEV